MGLRALVASLLVASTALAQQTCAELDYFWPDTPYELYGDAATVDPDLERRIRLESEKIPGVYRGLLDRTFPKGMLVFAYDAPSRVSRFSDLDPDAITSSGDRVDDALAFVVPESLLGYYNPRRVAQGSSSVNVYLHEVGHLVYHALDLPDSELFEEFVSLSEGMQAEMARHYLQKGFSDESYASILASEAFAESFARMYANTPRRVLFERDYPDLARFMTRLESEAIAVLDERADFGYEARCEVARLINPLPSAPRD